MDGSGEEEVNGIRMVLETGGGLDYLDMFYLDSSVAKVKMSK